MNDEEFMKFLAAWALVHETADEGWKAAVERGAAQGAGDMEGGPDAFVDGLAAAVARRKEQLKADLASGSGDEPGSNLDVGQSLDDLRFEVASLRGRLESMQASVDALVEARQPDKDA
ncbi:MAG: hypothetical protein HGB10_10305 [Coriobacteriia bacterium]|nr:hypothetical protein [Coriobacteriia bacterium]